MKIRTEATSIPYFLKLRLQSQGNASTQACRQEAQAARVQQISRPPSCPPRLHVASDLTCSAFHRLRGCPHILPRPFLLGKPQAKRRLASESCAEVGRGTQAGMQEPRRWRGGGGERGNLAKPCRQRRDRDRYR
eukprot:768637-Hanusia_phi.AAC.13